MDLRIAGGIVLLLKGAEQMRSFWGPENATANMIETLYAKGAKTG